MRKFHKLGFFSLGIVGLGASTQMGACGTTVNRDSEDAGITDAAIDTHLEFFDGNPCPPGKSTRVTGLIRDPSGVNPLYNVIAYVPSAPVDPFPTGVSCDRCGTVVHSPITSTLSGIDGKFVLDNVPAGDSVPIVVQVGKWRRQLTMPVVACEDNAADPEATRLPRKASEGDIPRIAVVTSGCDEPECFLRRIGLNDSEIGIKGSAAHVHLYGGYGAYLDAGPPGMTASTDLWNTKEALSLYDIVILGCECDEHSENKSPAALKAMHDYATAGGRVFASHFHYYWLNHGAADYQATATFTPKRTASAFTMQIDKSFPKGQALSDWISYIDAGTNGSIDQLVVESDVSAVGPTAQQWLTNTNPNGVVYYTFNTPIGQPSTAQCGRFVFTDLHMTPYDDNTKPLPARCTKPELQGSEKALEFLFFDLSSCIQDDAKPPKPPN